MAQAETVKVDKIGSDTAPVRQASQVGAAEAHSTGVVKPRNPDAKIKFLVREVPHGVGGFVPDANGNRVANELGRRNCVTGEMWENKFPSRPALDNAISDDIAWQCKHYTERGVRKLHESGTTLAEDMEARVSKMPDSIEAHCQASLKSVKDPDGGPYSAFASDKSWNEASGKTGSEKKFYHNVSSGADFAAQPFCVAEYVGPTPEDTYEHVTHVVECVTPASSVAHTAPVTTMTVASTVLTADTVPGDRYVDMPVVIQRQVPMIPNMQKTVEVPQIQYVDKIVEAPVVVTHQPVPVDAEALLRVEDVSIGTQTVSRKRRLSTETESADGEHGLVQGIESRREMDETRERHAAGEDLDLLPVAPDMEAGGSHLQAMTGEERIEIWTQDLREIRRMVEFLVRRERKLDVKADVAIPRLERLERENIQLEDEVLESSLPEAPADKTKVVKLLVDKWFVDKGFGFGKVPSGEVVFIHASAVQGSS